MDLPLQALVINLKRSTQRRKMIRDHLNKNKIPFKFIQAIEGENLSQQDILNQYNDSSAQALHRRSLLKNEIACALSHIACYQYIVEHNLASIVIFEDDITVTPGCSKVIRKLSEQVPSRIPQITLLSFHKYYSPLFKKELCEVHNMYKILPLWTNAWGAYGYHITLQAAKNLLSYYDKVKHVIDHWDHLLNQNVIELSCIVPYCVEHPAAEEDYSEVGNRNFQNSKPHSKSITNTIQKQSANLLKGIGIIKKQKR